MPVSAERPPRVSISPAITTAPPVEVRVILPSEPVLIGSSPGKVVMPELMAISPTAFRVTAPRAAVPPTSLPKVISPPELAVKVTGKSAKELSIVPKIIKSLPELTKKFSNKVRFDPSKVIDPSVYILGRSRFPRAGGIAGTNEVPWLSKETLPPS